VNRSVIKMDGIIQQDINSANKFAEASNKPDTQVAKMTGFIERLLSLPGKNMSAAA